MLPFSILKAPNSVWGSPPQEIWQWPWVKCFLMVDSFVSSSKNSHTNYVPLTKFGAPVAGLLRTIPQVWRTLCVLVAYLWRTFGAPLAYSHLAGWLAGFRLTFRPRFYVSRNSIIMQVENKHLRAFGMDICAELRCGSSHLSWRDDIYIF